MATPFQDTSGPDRRAEPAPPGSRPIGVTVTCWVFVVLPVLGFLAAPDGPPVVDIVLGFSLAAFLVAPAIYGLRGRHWGRVVLTTVIVLFGYVSFGVATDADSTTELVLPMVGVPVLVAMTALLWTRDAQMHFGHPGPSPVRPCAVATAACAGWMVVVLAALFLVQALPGRGLLWAVDVTIAVAVGAGMLTHLFVRRRPGRSWRAILGVSLLVTIAALAVAFVSPIR